MPQLSFYVPDDIAEFIKQAAEKEGKSISIFLADLVKSKFYPKEWSDHFFDTLIGQWQGEISEPDRCLPQKRNEFTD